MNLEFFDRLQKGYRTIHENITPAVIEKEKSTGIVNEGEREREDRSVVEILSKRALLYSPVTGVKIPERTVGKKKISIVTHSIAYPHP